MAEQNVYCRTSDLISKPAGSETIVLSVARGAYYGLNESGSAVWNKLTHPRGVETLAADLRSAFGIDRETALTDLEAFLTELQRQGLIQGISAPAGQNSILESEESALPPPQRPYSPPRLEVGLLRLAAHMESGNNFDGGITISQLGSFTS